MKKLKSTLLKLITNIIALAVIFIPGGILQTVQAQQSNTYTVGNQVGINSNGEFQPVSSNVKVYGGIYNAESCIYDPTRKLILVPSRGQGQNQQPNDAWVSLINHDGSIHTSKWIGVQNSNQRGQLDPPLVLNDPLGSTIADGILLIADRDVIEGSESSTVSVIRRFDLESGRPLEDILIEGSPWINDITVAEDGTIYTTQTGDLGQNADPNTWKVWKITNIGEQSEFIVGNPLNIPNGIAIDQDGNIVVVNFGNPEVLTFSPEGELLKTEQAVQAMGDGIEIMPDGTKYVSSVFMGGVSRIDPSGTAELIAENIPSAASMCYDSDANQLVIPLISQNGIAFIPLD
jgi:hypothetical protein